MIQHVIEVTGAFVLFGGIHSLLARPNVKRRLSSKLGNTATAYRILYNVLSLLMLYLIWALVPPQSAILYEIEPPCAWIGRGVQLIGVFVFLLTLRDYNVPAFLGLRHGDDADGAGGGTLNIRGMFRLCRHPMYFAIMLILLGNPVMSIGWFAYSVNIAAYFVIGSVFEERNLESRFGPAYAAYKAQVPRMLPRLRNLRRQL